MFNGGFSKMDDNLCVGCMCLLVILVFTASIMIPNPYLLILSIILLVYMFITF